MNQQEELERARLHPDVIKNQIKQNGRRATAEAYSPSNPPPYPVTSVNGQTGDVSIAVPALPISVSKGGTGADNAADARTNLGLGSAATEDIVPVSKGGTGADNAADARVNLGVEQSSKNNIGTGINLASYTSTYYTCPSDGFLACTCASTPSAKAIARIYGAAGETNFAQIGGWSNGTYATWTTLVRKGMRVKVVTLENSGGVIFYPLE